MKLTIPLSFLLLRLTLHAQTPTVIDVKGTDTVMEYTGQVSNAGMASTQVGYLNFLKGFDTAFSTTMPQDESTALFTFFTTVTTTRNVLNGSIRLVDREGTTTVYFAKGAADFANPDSFRSGTPIQTSSIRQQVLVDTISSGFTTSNYNIVNSAVPFTLNGATIQLGAPGQTFRTSITGHLTTTSPPSGYFAGYATPGNDGAAFLGASANPASSPNSAGQVEVTLTWGAPGASQVEIHVGAPDGVLTTGGGPAGSAMTGTWVTNGMKFYLQDVSGGKPLTAANTLAETTVIVE